jgi:hypothetical protein
MYLEDLHQYQISIYWALSRNSLSPDNSFIYRRHGSIWEEEDVEISDELVDEIVKERFC